MLAYKQFNAPVLLPEEDDGEAPAPSSPFSGLGRRTLTSSMGSSTNLFKPMSRRGENKDYCATCSDQGDLLCCDGCSNSFHTICCDPPMISAPSGDFFCVECRRKNRDFPESDSHFAPVIAHVYKSSPEEFMLHEPLILSVARDGEVIPGRNNKPTRNELKHRKNCYICEASCDRPDRVSCARCANVCHLWCCAPPLLTTPLRPWTCTCHPEHSGNVMESHILPPEGFALDFLPVDKQGVSRRKARPAQAVQLPKKRRLQGDERRVEDAFQGLVDTPAKFPSLESIKGLSLDQLASIDPIFVQFLAWQRLAQLKQDRLQARQAHQERNEENDLGDDEQEQEEDRGWIIGSGVGGDVSETTKAFSFGNASLTEFLSSIKNK